MKKTKLTALLLTGVLLISVFAGCNQSGGKVIAKIGDTTVKEDLFVYFMKYAAYTYESQGIQISTMLDQDVMDGVTGKDFLKQQALEQSKYYAAIEKFAKENDITITDEDKEELKKSKDEQVEQMGGRSEYLKKLQEANLTEEAIDELNRLSFLQNKVSTALFSTGGKFAPDQNKVVDELVNNYFRVKHILIKATEQDKDFAAKKTKAQDVLKRAQSGEDFDKLLKEFGEDPGMDSTPEGYVIDKEGQLADKSSTMDKNFTAGSTSLAVGAVSKALVTTSYGFHIIKRFPFDKAYVTEHIKDYMSSYSSSAFQAKIDEVMKTLNAETTDVYNNYDVAKLFATDANANNAGAGTGTTTPSTGDSGTTAPSTGDSGTTAPSTGDSGTTAPSTGDSGTAGQQAPAAQSSANQPAATK